MNKSEKTTPVTMQDLKALMDRLRGAGGCPWDRRQNTESLKIYLLEETYELADALDRQAAAEVKEELGDLLFQIVFLSRVFEEQGDFDLDQVIEGIHQKMVRRHPHIFGKTKWEKAEQVVQGWQDIKTQEKNGQDPFESIPVMTPSLLKAHRISQRAAGLGFDWPHITAVLEKVSEELKELEEALQAEDTVAAGEELGDLLFTLVNLGRFMGITAENALRITIQKFLARFRLMINNPLFTSNQAAPLSSEAWETLWEESKTQHSESSSHKGQGKTQTGPV
jgi:MazG family protein